MEFNYNVFFEFYKLGEFLAKGTLSCQEVSEFRLSNLDALDVMCVLRSVKGYHFTRVKSIRVISDNEIKAELRSGESLLIKVDIQRVPFKKLKYRYMEDAR
ncbi:hypothetical protein ACTFQF_00375 [Aliivibrio fischeri]|uniref:Uncharacterized protein n=1 Tax=Aliivibrio fischeri (strain MJ11) TaxID=388396 RepID=B5EVY4_ALIFM|nr:hypothetical protein [Aliivibrio fischeri]ACH64779.1 hypothetical protein VFMJ11_B0041 [Aliivibrio fischeri MJ11]